MLPRISLLIIMLFVIPALCEGSTGSYKHRVAQSNGIIPVGTIKLASLSDTGQLSIENLLVAVDSVWGEGLNTEKKLEIFDAFWLTIDQEYACFNNLDVNWDSLRTVYRPQVEAGVSRGRFAAIMNHLALALREFHTVVGDWLVNWRTALEPGIPVHVMGSWVDQGHFGAGLTLTADSSLLVYKVAPDHPLGLEPGDLVLGYEGIAWKLLCNTLLHAELPVKGHWGSSRTSFEHSLMMSAGLNWHLFNIIDIVKYSSGDTLHLPTSQLVGAEMAISGTEQMAIPGVPMPDIYTDDHVSWGIVDGTQIGYIYVWSWYSGSGPKFYNAVDSLLHHFTTTGLILDFRFNTGGYMNSSDYGLALLFNTTDTTFGYAQRCNPDDHFAMCPSMGPYLLHGDPDTFYEKPIAVLTGPGAASAGDLVPLKMKFHEMARFFGKSTATSFNIPAGIVFEDTSFYKQFASEDAYLFNSPNEFLTHREFPVDEEVWLTREDVARGYDTVVEAAREWIEMVTSIEPHAERIPSTHRLFWNYPNPFNPSTAICYDLSQFTEVSLVVYDLLGRNVITLVDSYMEPGYHQITWDGRDADCRNIPSGIYIARLITPGYTKSIKTVLLK
jgi:hypothetical protein